MTTAHRGSAPTDLSPHSVDQLRDLRARVDVELQLRGEEKRTSAPLLAQFYDASQFALRARGVVFRPYKSIKKRFDGEVAVPLEVVRSMRPKSRIKSALACKIVAGAIIEDILERRLTLSSNTYMNSMSRAGYALDRQFPGYRASGFLPKLLERI